MRAVPTILAHIDPGDPFAADQRLPVIQAPLRQLAARKLAHVSGHGHALMGRRPFLIAR